MGVNLNNHCLKTTTAKLDFLEVASVRVGVRLLDKCNIDEAFDKHVKSIQLKLLENLQRPGLEN